MSTITREEMIRMARETRRQVMSAVVPDELMRQYPAQVEELAIPSEEGDIRAFMSTPDEMKNPEMFILNMHGGGFIRGRTENDELFCRKLNHAFSCRVLDLDYKIAPDYPFPIAVHEAYRTLRWVFENAKTLGIDPNRVVLMGHSAGGNLCVGAVMRSLEEHRELPACLVCEYPPLDLYTDPGEKKSMGKGIPAERARLYNLYYCDRELQKDPYCSPIFAPDRMLEGFPPTLMITCGFDSLCNEAEEFALRLARCGSEVTVRRFLGANHGFTIYRSEGHEEAFRLIRSYIAGHV